MYKHTKIAIHMQPYFLNNLQLLRAIAAIFVTLLHIEGAVSLYSASPEDSIFKVFKNIGWAGVDLFFVLSGFMMVYVSADKVGVKHAPVDFLKARIIRIAPLYWLVTSATLALLLVYPTIFRWLALDWWHVIASYMFLPAQNMLGLVQPLVPVGWTLSYEMYFYAIFALGLLLPNLWWLMVTITVYFTASVLLQPYSDPSNIYSQFLTNSILLEFVLGAWAGIGFFKNRLPNTALCILLIISCILWVGIVGYRDELQTLNRVILWGIPCLCLIYALITLEKKNIFVTPAWIVAIGNSSYALYLTHYFVLAIWGRLAKSAGLANFIGPNGFAIISLILCLIGAHILHVRLEKPITVFLKQRFISH